MSIYQKQYISQLKAEQLLAEKAIDGTDDLYLSKIFRHG